MISLTHTLFILAAVHLIPAAVWVSLWIESWR